MRRIQAVGIGLLGLVGLAFCALGIDDIRLTNPPPTHQAYFEKISGNVPPEVHALILYMFDGQGGLFLGAGLAVLILCAGPIRKGDGWALAAALAIVTFGNAGIILGLRNMQASYNVLVVMLVVGVVGAALAWAGRRSGT